MTIASKIETLISEQIISGRFKPGERLDERLLAQEFNVSRTPVREALRQLAARGLTQLLPMRGVVVTETSVKELSEILHAHCELEAMCARLAAESMTAMEKLDLQYIHERSNEHVAKGELDKYLEANHELHRLILEGVHNPTISRLVEEMRDRLTPYRQYHPEETDRLTVSHDAHRDIIDAIMSGDGEKAYLAMRTHNARLGNAALRSLRQAEENQEAQAPRSPPPAAGDKPGAKRPTSAPTRGRPRKTTAITEGAEEPQRRDRKPASAAQKN